ncbi:APC family amino acid-polyamine-organocationtransporter [Weissella oryzae SG25]|uniref:APC family amino acid-polyamine-organocationtransporter n=1 Tax=Weissella oryzae (strain DSM 25784 / JCM 18191 / LMG 30913 / SG25) TaxID=1329250 RepID=A0A069CQV6_WEIOS|nr:amino acid permease [Weissella oryzae]GAK30090.1 APC family amino acid-polyamine-organocationtransporter [Weissella oryzae SG25]
MGKQSFFAQFWVKENPQTYADKDGKLKPVLGTKEMIAMGIGTVVGAGIFTMPGIVAAEYAGPAVVLSFVVAALIAGLSALAYSEFASAMPFAGSVYTWANVIFGEFTGWMVGWAILAEYVVALALVSSSWSAYFQGFVGSLGFKVPTIIGASFNLSTGSWFDLFGALALIGVGYLVARGMKGVAIIENWLVIGKVAVILIFVAVGLTAVHVQNWQPFIPAHRPGTNFGGWHGIMMGASQVFFAYLGFDMLAANSAEVKDAQKTMPKAIIGTLVIATLLFIAVASVLTGMFHYSKYAGNAEPAAWALRQAGHVFTANLLSLVALVGMFAGLIGLMVGGSRLVYSFGRDSMLPKTFGKLDKNKLPTNAVWLLTIVGVVLGAIFPVAVLANLVSAGTLIAFVVASVGVIFLRQRKDIDHSGYKLPFYPVLPILAALSSLALLISLNADAQILMIGWLILGAAFYLFYSRRHSINYHKK